jgi:hypothetical protein
MEPIKDYFTAGGWKRDWEKTKQDVTFAYDSGIEAIAKKAGEIPLLKVAIPVTTFAMIPLTATLGMVAGEYAGKAVGHAIDLLPYVNQFVPWVVHHTGELGKDFSNHDLNVQFCEASFSLLCTLYGAWWPLKSASKIRKQL